MKVELLMDLKEFCALGNFSMSKGRKIILNNEINFYKLGSLIRIKKADAIDWIESKKVASKKEAK